MEQLELEFWAAEIRRIAGLSDDEIALGPEIAVRIVGDRNVLLCDGHGAARTEGRRIIVPQGHPDLNFAFAHEVAEIVLEERARPFGTHNEKERAANYIGTAILAPPHAVHVAAEHFGEHLGKISRVFGISQTSAQLRLGEVTGIECGVVTSKHNNVLARNPARLDWTDPLIVDIAHGRRRLRGITKVKLTSGIDDRRVAIRVR